MLNYDNLTYCIFAVLLLGEAGCSGPNAKSVAEMRGARQRAAEELSGATALVDQLPEIPAAVRERARCIVVAPSSTRPGVVTIGGRHGYGVATCRVGAAWSAPVFVSLTAGSEGPRIDVDSSDLVMLVMSERGMSQMFRPTFVLGADASESAGPTADARGAAHGGQAAAGSAEVLSYARWHGLFEGAPLSGGFVNQDLDALSAMYGQGADVPGVLGGSVAAPREAADFLARVAAAFPAGTSDSPGSPDDARTFVPLRAQWTTVARTITTSTVWAACPSPRCTDTPTLVPTSPRNR